LLAKPVACQTRRQAILTANHVHPHVIRNHTFTWGSQTYVMGILNATPDSFSGDGLVDPDPLRAPAGGAGWVQQAIEQGRRFVAEGAHILDVGGESTRPGSQPVDADEELRRVLPVIEGLAALVDVPISIDTSKAAVAARALQAGASIVNDVWGLRLDPPIAQVAAQAGAPVILMHNRSQREHVTIDPALGGRYVGTAYGDLLGDIAAELQISIDLARRAGIPDGHIILDPGIGFGKTVAQNLALLDRLGELRAWAIRCWPAPAASPSSATPWTCPLTSASRAQPQPSPSPSPAAPTSCACTTCRPWRGWRA
jgi:dihydropteroate synthase